MNQTDTTELEDIDLDTPVEGSPETRELVLAFVRLPMEGKFTFVCKAGMGDRIIQRMRIRLAKLRGIAKSRKRILRSFKMVKVNIEAGAEGTETVTLLKTMHQHQVAVSKHLEDALAEISSEGVTING